ncbi:uncharacterized protein LOC121110124 isoform X2 [Gallus gallus]|uniref:uncharacterized protein LOC121110124 isoform X2 n=1 Tax=Gallus gallus TaxID=9031 RepID=UPI001AEAC653|nr:uncharacterized protein LOC121110124 isoform X2 [Gallus gallus]
MDLQGVLTCFRIKPTVNYCTQVKFLLIGVKTRAKRLSDFQAQILTSRAVRMEKQVTGALESRIFPLPHTSCFVWWLEGSSAHASLLLWKDDLAVLSDLDQAPETLFGLKGLALQPCECHHISRTLSELASPYPTSALCWWVSHPAAVSAEGYVAEGCPPCLQSQNDRIPPVGRDSRGLPNPTPRSTQHHSNRMSESTVQTFLEVCLVSELQRMRG